MAGPRGIVGGEIHEYTRMFDPAVHVWIHGNGKVASRGWPERMKLEAPREAWPFAADDAARKRITENIRRQVFVDVPYIPLGRFRHARRISGM